MKTVPIDIEIIASTQVRKAAVERWLKKLGCSDAYLDEISALDTGDLSDPAFLVAIAAKQCYRSFEPGLNKNVTKVRRNWVEYLDNILKSGHGSVCEHAVFSFAITGVSRVFTGEMNRHRAGVAISEASMRYIRYDDIPYWLPTSITVVEGEDTSPETKKLMLKKLRSQAVFTRAFGQMEENYKELEEIWCDELKPEAKFAGKKHVTSMMRRIIGMGVATGGVWTLNIRALRHIMALRASPAAEEEILHVWGRAGEMMVKEEPALFGDFSITPEGYWVPKYPKV